MNDVNDYILYSKKSALDKSLTKLFHLLECNDVFCVDSCFSADFHTEQIKI